MSRRRADTMLMDEEIEQPLDEQVLEKTAEQSIITQQDASNGEPKRNVRGATKGLSLQKKWQPSQKLDVIIHPRNDRIVGDNAKDFKTEACVLVKHFSPVQFTRWREIPIDNKRKMWMGMKQKFDLKEDVGVKKVVFEQFNRQFRSYRHKLHQSYLENKSKPTILDKLFPGVSREDWKILINYFESDEFKKISMRNKENRKKLKMNHRCGTKSIAQYCYEQRDPETGKEPTRTHAWKLSRYSEKKKAWVDEASEKVYDELVKLQSQQHEDGGDPITEDEAFVRVLGEEKSSRLRGCGDGRKPPSKRGERINTNLQKENEELRKQNEELASRFESLEAQITNNEANLQGQLEALMRAQLPAIMESFKQTNQLPNSN